MKHKLVTTLFLFIFAAALIVSCNNVAAQTTTQSETGIMVESGDTDRTLETVTETTITDSSVQDIEMDVSTDTDEIARPDGWSEDSHDKSADPDYDTVFPDDEVNRLDITISAENWEAMMADMTELYGGQSTSAPGAGPGGGRQAGGGPRGGGGPVNDPAGGGRPAGGPPEGGRPGEGVGGFGGPGLEEETDNPIWVESTIEFEDDTWTNVGIRFKGNSSLRDSWNSGDLKMPLKLDFDEFEDEYPEIDDQRFYGFKQLSLSSNYRDESFMRETVAYDVFEDMGVTTPATAFYEVYVDYGEGPVYFGLYTMIEVVDDTVIETNFEDDNGNVYKPDGIGSSFAAGSFNEDDFDKETNGDEADYGDILALYDVLHSDQRITDPATWRSDLEAMFDTDTFLRWLATNTVIQNWDTYGVAYHNYYLYTDPASGQLTWIPWDNNESLTSSGGRSGVLSLSLDEVGDDWPLISYLIADEVYQAQYVAYVEEVAETAFNPATMEMTYQALYDLIQPYAVNEIDESAFNAAVVDLVEHTDDRYEAVQNFLASQG